SACPYCFVNQGDGHLFHLQRNQSSSFVPQMACHFFDSVSSAAASASAFSFLRSSFSRARLFLRSAANSALLAGASVSALSKASRQASICSGYSPRLRQYSVRSDSFFAAVCITAVSLALAAHSSA